MRKRKMVLCGNFGAGNLGDEAILRSLVNQFSPQYDLTVVSANPIETRDKFGVETIAPIPSGIRSNMRLFYSREARHIYEVSLNAIQECDIFVLAGGTLLTDTPPTSMIIWNEQIKPALEMNKEIWIYGGGIGPIKGKWAQRVVHSILEKAEVITVRDAQSLKWAKKLGGTHATQGIDPVLEAAWLPMQNNNESFKNSIIFVPRFWRKNIDNTKKSFKEFVHYLVHEEGKKVIGIPFEKWNKNEAEFLNTIFEQANAGECAKIWDDYEGEHEVISAMAAADLVVGMRLHSLLFAHIANTPFIGVAYMEKVKDVLETLGKADQVIDLDNLDTRTLITHYQALAKVSL